MKTEVVRELETSEKGVDIQFDSRPLFTDEYLQGLNDSESYSIEDRPDGDNQVNESYESSQFVNKKSQRFRNAGCRAWIVDRETYGNVDAVFVRLIESRQADNMSDILKGNLV